MGALGRKWGIYTLKVWVQLKEPLKSGAKYMSELTSPDDLLPRMRSEPRRKPRPPREHSSQPKRDAADGAHGLPTPPLGEQQKLWFPGAFLRNVKNYPTPIMILIGESLSKSKEEKECMIEYLKACQRIPAHDRQRNATYKCHDCSVTLGPSDFQVVRYAPFNLNAQHAAAAQCGKVVCRECKPRGTSHKEEPML